MSTPSTDASPEIGSGTLRLIGRLVLAAALATSGVLHFVWMDQFRLLLPNWTPGFLAIGLVGLSGIINLLLAYGLLRWKDRVLLGWLLAVYFTLLGIAHVTNLVNGNDALGMTSDLDRWVRLGLQPVLVVWGVWCTGARAELKRIHSHLD